MLGQLGIQGVDLHTQSLIVVAGVHTPFPSDMMAFSRLLRYLHAHDTHNGMKYTHAYSLIKINTSFKTNRNEPTAFCVVL